MPRNLSVQQFQQLMASIPKAIIGELDAAVFDNAQRLSDAQKSAVHVDTGNFRASHRVEAGRKPLRAVVRAGGALTTRSSRGGSYDYANAQEFGNEKTPARPSFYPTYRLLKKTIRANISSRARKAIGKVVNLK